MNYQKKKLRILQNEEISGKPQNWVKTSLVIVLENFKKFRMHKLPHELPNDFRLRILRNEDILVQTEPLKIECRHSLVPSLPSRNKSLATAPEN